MHKKSIKLIVPMVMFLVALFLAIVVRASSGDDYVAYLPISIANNCDDWPNGVPAGALPEQPPPVWCLINNYGPPTEQPGLNSWFDDFDHGLSFGTFDGTQYRTYNEIGAWRTIFWRHADHWMVDLAPRPIDGGPGYAKGYTLMRPDQPFQFDDGVLTIETTVAAAMEAYGAEAWPEIIVSNASDPSGQLPGGTYGYDLFPNHYTLGCRLQPNRRPVCALKSNDGSTSSASTRIWEMSWFQEVGTYTWGGNELGGRDAFWQECALDDPDIVCRNHFRLELTSTSLKIYVSDELYFEQSGIPSLPNELVSGDVYVYLGSSHVNHDADTIRYHWDNFIINNTTNAALAKQAALFSQASFNFCSLPSNKDSEVVLSANESLLP